MASKALDEIITRDREIALLRKQVRILEKITMIQKVPSQQKVRDRLIEIKTMLVHERYNDQLGRAALVNTIITH